MEVLLSVEREGKFYNNKNHKFQIQLQILDWIPGLMVSTPQSGGGGGGADCLFLGLEIGGGGGDFDQGIGKFGEM